MWAQYCETPGHSPICQHFMIIAFIALYSYAGLITGVREAREAARTYNDAIDVSLVFLVALCGWPLVLLYKLITEA